MPVRVSLFVLLLCVLGFPAVAQTIRGDVMDMDTKKPISAVDIQNIYTLLNITTDDQGGFIIAANSGQLLEFKKTGYKTARVRVPQGYVPPYFRILLKKGISEINQDIILVHNNRYDYTEDSIRYHELYKTALDFPKLSGLGVVQSPFSALSKKNREVWQFQDDYKEFEREKYVDKTFNAELITKFTGLKGDSLRYFMRRYRPSYEQLKAMNDYSFYNFIQSNARRYRSPDRPVNGQ